MEQPGVVWVLGAGFSRFLGGPLLNDLFSDAVCERVVSLAPLNAKTRLGRLHELYKTTQQRDHLAGPMRNAEEFSELLDAAADWRNADRANRAQKLLTPLPRETGPAWTDFAEWSKVCRQHFTLACHEFVGPSSDDFGERWDPYLEWARQLAPEDWVLSFNYDLVVERAFGAAKVPVYVRGIWDTPKGAGAVRLIKLHGSADWFESNGNIVSQDPHSLIENDFDPLIAAPGPRKASMVAGVFSDLWRAAERALASATVVVFVGYRFPETDVVAKRRLLGALASGTTPLIIRVVLGPERSHADIVRLAGLLRWSLHAQRRWVAQQEPMWAQDFLAVFKRNGLYYDPEGELVIGKG